MRQLAKKLESSKATAHHIKQVAGDPQAAQINLLRHQCTELPAGKYKKKRPPMKSKNLTTSHRVARVIIHKCNTRRDSTLRVHTITRTDVPNVVTQPTWRDSSVQQKYQCKACHKFGHFTSICFQKSKQTSNPEGLKHAGCKQVQFMQKEVPPMTTLMRKALQKIHFACKSRSNTSKTKNKRCQDQLT